jgi:hypothetical protein
MTIPETQVQYGIGKGLLDARGLSRSDVRELAGVGEGPEPLVREDRVYEETRLACAFRLDGAIADGDRSPMADESA